MIYFDAFPRDFFFFLIGALGSVLIRSLSIALFCFVFFFSRVCFDWYSRFCFDPFSRASLDLFSMACIACFSRVCFD